jgi:peptide/nickel transport system substrate-binding protein
MRWWIILVVTSLASALLAGDHGVAAPAYKPEGEMRYAVYVTISPAWFDPAEAATAGITPFWFCYALHDAMLKPMPDNPMAPSLAESWTVSPDQRVYEFKLREGLKFHNGDPFTAEDVKFSFERYKWPQYHRDKFQQVEVVDPYRVRIHLVQPWPDFMTFYGTLTTAAGWIVPKKYIEKVGDEGFRKHPIGLGPYKFVSYTPGIELVMEAVEGYWRKVPHRPGPDDAPGHAEEGRSRCCLRSGGRPGRGAQAGSQAARGFFRGDRHRHAGFPR